MIGNCVLQGDCSSGGIMLVTSILISLLQIFVLILPGVFFRKKNLITVEQNSGLSDIVVNLTWPCLLIDAMQIPFEPQMMMDCGRITVIALLIFAVLAVLSVPLAMIMRV